MPRKINELSGAAVLQLNAEGSTRSKCKVVHCIATKYSVILLQEKQTTRNDNIKVYGFSLIGAILHAKHGIATLVRNDVTATLVQSRKKDSEMQWLTIMINDDISIPNIYKPPKAPFLPPPWYQHPAIYSGDFNCHHTSLGYSSNNADGETLHEWAHTVDLKLLFNHRQPKSFHSAV